MPRQYTVWYADYDAQNIWARSEYEAKLVYASSNGIKVDIVHCVPAPEND